MSVMSGLSPSFACASSMPGGIADVNRWLPQSCRTHWSPDRHRWTNGRVQRSGSVPTQLVVEFPSRLRATSPRIRRELALGASTALALSALAVALAVVLTGLVVFTGSWPGFAPGEGGETTLATTASQDAADAPAPTRLPAPPVVPASPIASPVPAATTAAPARRAHHASHHRR